MPHKCRPRLGLGSAVGDWTAFSLHLGYAASAALFTVAIAVRALDYR